MASPSYSTVHDDPLLKILRLERENFLQQHANLPATERNRLWIERSKQLTSILDPDLPLSDTTEVACPTMVCVLLRLESVSR